MSAIAVMTFWFLVLVPEVGIGISPEDRRIVKHGALSLQNLLALAARANRYGFDMGDR